MPWDQWVRLLDFSIGWISVMPVIRSINSPVSLKRESVDWTLPEKDGVQDGPCLLQIPDFLFHLCKGTKGPGHGQAYMFFLLIP